MPRTGELSPLGRAVAGIVTGVRGRAPGDKIGDRYEIRRLLGVGGMGEVYEAIASSGAGFTRRVAVKVLASDDRTGEDVASFREEVRVLARIHHGGIVGVVDFGDIAGTPFLVLEMIDGASASDAVRRARMPSVVALAVVVDVARALHHAHTLEDGGRPLGIVHRDVKPSNILLSWEGDVKLGDFGIALASDRSTTKTTGAFSKGTPGFMAPEQLLGSPVDARTDVFALGCTLHALLTGASPIRGQDDVVHLLSGTPPTLDAAIEADVRALIARATALEPGARHPSALAFAEDAARALAPRLRRDARGEIVAYLASVRGAVVAPAPETRVERRTPPRASTARSFLVAVLGTIAVGAIFALGVGAELYWSRNDASERTSASVDASTEVGPEAAPVLPDPAPEEDAPEAPDATPDAAPSRALAARPVRRTTERSADRQVVPDWASDRVACSACECGYRMVNDFVAFNDYLCKAITEPRCVCWTERTYEQWNRFLLCGSPRRADGTCDVRDVPATPNGPCRGWEHPSRDGGLVSGRWRCSTCDRDYGACTQGTPCKGVTPEGVPMSGHLKCTE